MTQPSRTQLVAALVATAQEARVACGGTPETWGAGPISQAPHPGYCNCHGTGTIQPPLAAAIVTAFTVECECLSTGGDVSAYAFGLMCRKCMIHRGEHGDWCRCNGTGRVSRDVDTWPIGAVAGAIATAWTNGSGGKSLCKFVADGDGWRFDIHPNNVHTYFDEAVTYWSTGPGANPDTAAVNAVMRALEATE